MAVIPHVRGYFPYTAAAMAKAAEGTHDTAAAAAAGGAGAFAPTAAAGPASQQVMADAEWEPTVPAKQLPGIWSPSGQRLA